MIVLGGVTAGAVTFIIVMAIVVGLVVALGLGRVLSRRE